MDFDKCLNYFALALFSFVFITLFYGIIAIHDVLIEAPVKAKVSLR
jgi:hypothetical protein